MKVLNSKKVLDAVYEVVESLAKEMDLLIWNICFEKEGKNQFLRVYLDKKNGLVDLNDCEILSNEISKMLDEIDPIDRSYFLEVSSVGAGRRLLKEEHFKRLKGRLISIKLYRAFEGKKKFDGVLRDFANSKIKLETDDEIIEVLFSNCAYVKLKDEDEFELF